MTTSRRMTWSSRRPTKRKALEKRLDKLSKELCRLKAGGICAICGQYGCEAHHILSCNYKRYRWSQENLAYVCRPCHRKEHDEEPTLVSELDRRVKHWSLPELQELEKSLKEQIKAFR